MAMTMIAKKHAMMAAAMDAILVRSAEESVYDM